MEDIPGAIEPLQIHAATPAGETGVDDHRDSLQREGRGHVSDALGLHSIYAERHDPSGDTPTADDPYGTTPRASQAHQNAPPTYEAGQGTADPDTGGSTDPHNSMTHANSGNESENTMNESNTDKKQSEQPAVDGFSDTEGSTQVASPDPGNKSNVKPLNPEEYAEQQKEARTEEHKK